MELGGCPQSRERRPERRRRRHDLNPRITTNLDSQPSSQIGSMDSPVCTGTPPYTFPVAIAASRARRDITRRTRVHGVLPVTALWDKLVGVPKPVRG
jgi:hypothetical protein